MTTLSIITVVYNNYQILDDFFASFAKQTNTSFHVYIADLSTEKKSVTLPAYASLFTAENKGYAFGVNEGIKKAMADDHSLFCVVNSDVIFSDTFVDEALSILEKHPQSIIGGKIYYAKGFEYHTDRYSPEDQGKVFWYAGGITDWAHALTHHRGVDDVDKKQFDTFEPTAFITGCLMLYDKSVVETVGPWDESYFLYYEDADFCERAKQKHIPLYYDPQLVIWHKNAQSTHGPGSALHVSFQRKNRLKYALKYAPIRTKLHVALNYLLGRG